jgi:hypothetical protein
MLGCMSTRFSSPTTARVTKRRSSATGSPRDLRTSWQGSCTVNCTPRSRFQSALTRSVPSRIQRAYQVMMLSREKEGSMPNLRSPARTA